MEGRRGKQTRRETERLRDEETERQRVALLMPIKLLMSKKANVCVLACHRQKFDMMMPLLLLLWGIVFCLLCRTYVEKCKDKVQSTSLILSMFDEFAGFHSAALSPSPSSKRSLPAEGGLQAPLRNLST